MDPREAGGAEGLEPGVRIGFFVRAIRETAGGRAVGPWSDYAQTYMLVPDTLVAACSNERQLPLEYEIRTRLPRQHRYTATPTQLPPRTSS